MTKQPTFQYDQRSATYTTQFLMSATDEELVLDCSSGVIQDAAGQPVLPIHTRLAIPWSSAKQLKALLDQVVDAQDARDRTANGQGTTPVAPLETTRTAQLPTFEGS